MRDYIKRGATLARVAVSYGLHERLVVQADRANEIKASQNAQAEVFKAYVGGLFREQGVSPVDLWLRSVFRVDVQSAYENIRRERLLPPVREPNMKKPIVCPDCGHSFTRKQDLKLHMDSVHGDRKPFVCPAGDCGHTFTRKGDLKRHMESMHGDGAV